MPWSGGWPTRAGGWDGHPCPFFLLFLFFFYLPPLPPLPPPLPGLGRADRIGRAPAAFKWTNIFLNGGDVALKARRDTQWNFPPNPPSLADDPPIYTTWTTAFMQSWRAVRYGFFEVRAKYVSCFSFFLSSTCFFGPLPSCLPAAAAASRRV